MCLIKCRAWLLRCMALIIRCDIDAIAIRIARSLRIVELINNVRLVEYSFEVILV